MTPRTGSVVDAARVFVGAVVGLVIVGGAASAAQPWPGRVEASAGAAWIEGAALGSQDALLTENVRTDPGRLRLFATESDFEAAPAVEARLGFRVSSVFTVEGHFGYARPRVVTRISDDFEGAPATMATATLSQYIVDASLVAHLTGASARDGRLVPFVIGGAGYLRQLHRGARVVGSGTILHVGGGLKYLMRRTPEHRLKGVGVRGDVQIQIQRNGFDIEDRQRTAASGGASVFLLF